MERPIRSVECPDNENQDRNSLIEFPESRHKGRFWRHGIQLAARSVQGPTDQLRSAGPAARPAEVSRRPTLIGSAYPVHRQMQASGTSPGGQNRPNPGEPRCPPIMAAPPQCHPEPRLSLRQACLSALARQSPGLPQSCKLAPPRPESARLVSRWEDELLAKGQRRVEDPG